MAEERKRMNIKGDPTVTAGPRQKSISTFKDMYGIFDTMKQPKKVNNFAPKKKKDKIE